jgi:hypothetical protein
MRSAAWLRASSPSAVLAPRGAARAIPPARQRYRQLRGGLRRRLPYTMRRTRGLRTHPRDRGHRTRRTPSCNARVSTAMTRPCRRLVPRRGRSKEIREARHGDLPRDPVPGQPRLSRVERTDSEDRRAFLAYLPRGSHLALEKSTSGISRSERFLVSPAAAAEFDHCRDDLNETRQTYRKQMTSRARRASKARS